MDSKVLIEHCRAAGLTVKGSALASISPEEKQLVLTQIAASGGSATKAPEPQGELTPTRVAPREPAGRVRNLSGIGRPAAEEAEVEPEVEEKTPPAEVAVDEVLTPAAAVESEPAASAEPEPESTDAALPEGDSNAGDAASVDDGSSETPTPTPAPAAAPADEALESLKRDDYVSAHGKKREVREMKPQPRSMTAVDRSTRRGARGKQALPSLAAPPKFETQQPKQKEEPERAQKPVISLTPDQILGQKSPLQQHLERSAKDKESLFFHLLIKMVVSFV